MPKLVTRECAQCGKGFEIPVFRTKNGGGKYCSRECRNASSATRLNGGYPEQRARRVGEPFILDGEWVVTVGLTRGKATIIDLADIRIAQEYSWNCRARGYAVRSERVGGKVTTFWLHRQIMDAPEEMEVDHINGNTLDNRRSNLRIVTRAQNTQNRWGYKSKSGARGVIFDKKTSKWRVTVGLEGKKFHFGLFETVEEAIPVAVEARAQLLEYNNEKRNPHLI